MQTITFRMDGNTVLLIEHRALYPIAWDGPWWKIIWVKECVYIYVCMYDWVILLYSRNWPNTVNQLYFKKKKNFFKKKKMVQECLPTQETLCWTLMKRIQPKLLTTAKGWVRVRQILFIDYSTQAIWGAVVWKNSHPLSGSSQHLMQSLKKTWVRENRQGPWSFPVQSWGKDSCHCRKGLQGRLPRSFVPTVSEEQKLSMPGRKVKTQFPLKK